MSVTVRFAPSPTGRLHAGNIRTAIINALFARNAGGAFILRLDDTDKERSTEAFVRGIEEDIAWLGLEWSDKVRQSDRLARYDAAVEKLKAVEANNGLLSIAMSEGQSIGQVKLIQKKIQDRLRELAPQPIEIE